MARCRSTAHDYLAVGFAEEGEGGDDKIAYLICASCGDYTAVGLRRSHIPRAIRLAFPETAEEPRD